MIKITVTCERCGNEATLIPTTKGKHAYLPKQLFNQNFRMDECEIEVEVFPDLNDSFIESLASTKSKEKIKQILENDIADNVGHESSLQELRFGCETCGDYIVLTGFND
ncbi:hypothetical protein BSNK01_00040 [Bacillaceae bacterium]